eukprot:COSAG05_NODE_8898_length_663_cov_1.271277_1_plen_54_part_01
MCMPSCLRVCEIYTIHTGSGNMQGLASRVYVAIFASRRVLRRVVCGGSTGCHDR